MDVKRTIASELHKPTRRNFKTRRVTVKGVNDIYIYIYKVDLVEMIPYSCENHFYKYDKLSDKLAITETLKTKSGSEVSLVLETILEKTSYESFSV